MNRCAGDEGFGPALSNGPGCYSFDFTLAFEDYFFSIAPCALAISLAAWRLYTLVGREAVIKWPAIRALKLVCWGVVVPPPVLPPPVLGLHRIPQVGFTVLAAVHLVLVALLGTGYGVRVHTTLAASIVALFAILSLLVLSDVEHRRSIRPSAVIQVFFLFTILLDVPRLRTQWLLDQGPLIPALLTVVLGLRIALLTVESLQKWKHSTLPPEATAPEYRQGVLGRTFFTWLNPLFFEGYKRDLEMEDLFQIDDDLKGKKLYSRLLKQWKAGKKALCRPLRRSGLAAPS